MATVASFFLHTSWPRPNYPSCPWANRASFFVLLSKGNHTGGDLGIAAARQILKANASEYGFVSDAINEMRSVDIVKQLPIDPYELSFGV